MLLFYYQAQEFRRDGMMPTKKIACERELNGGRSVICDTNDAAIHYLGM